MNNIILISVAVLLVLIIISMINRLIRRKNEVEKIFGSVDALLKKRYDLIPNLISSVQNYMIHEKEVLTSLTELRARAINPDISSNEKIEIQNKLSRTLGGIMVAVEAYPDLKASVNFLQLQASLNEVEEQISAGRRAYNAAVTDYNNAVELLPSNLIAMMIGYKRKSIMETPENERENVSVKQLFKS
ncbi:MAG TPA: LemA family protein [Bacteroidales bacterium]|nr:LemA family protein [Bacteroidales bacterium]